MPKRVIDFDAMWASDKLASCEEWAQSEYAWLYGLADASGSFELTNLRVIWGRVAAVRKNLSLERLREIFDEFIARGLLFTWEVNGKRYGHWTGSDVPGRLPAPSWRVRLEKLAPPVPAQGLAAYSARFGGSKEGIAAAAAHAPRLPRGSPTARQARLAGSLFDSDIGARARDIEHAEVQESSLKHDLEEAQAQDWDLGLDSEKDSEEEVCLAPQQAQKRRLLGAPLNLLSGRMPESHGQEEPAPSSEDMPPDRAAEELREIYERERGELPAAGVLTEERRRRCAGWLAGGLTPEDFRAAVRSAAATPFLAGNGNRGWQASFDWLIANRTNARKVLAGEYAPRERPRAGKTRAERRVPADLYAGVGPRAADCGVRVNPAALERIRAREARSACEGVPPKGVAVSAVDGAARAPIAFDAQARASPPILKS